MKQTAVNWLDSNLIHAPHSQEDFNHNYRVFEQAKAMEQEQIKQAFKDCHDLGHIYGLDTEQYYNETYGIHD
jgi:ABC-type Zn2+ transport system substrate-binding protein/surface adhesin